VPRCSNGHEQRLGLKCQTCQAELSYRDSIDDLLALPKVEPDYGKVTVLTVACPGLSLGADFIGEIASGQVGRETSTAFQVASISGGNWLDLYKKHLQEARRWLTLVGIDKSTVRFLIVDTADPLSVLALAALPKLKHTAVIAVAADQDSTPLEQNTSYVALSLALKKGLPVIALSETFQREMLYFTEDREFATNADAMSRLLEPLLAAAADLMDVLEKDLKLGLKMHCLSAILAGSGSVYGSATNAFIAQSYDVSIATRQDEYQSVHSFGFSRKETESEFEKGFGAFRNKKFKRALSAEFRFRETASRLYDLITIYGLDSDAPLRSIAGGYEAILRNLPELNVDAVS
jgi:hypothetical protein